MFHQNQRFNPIGPMHIDNDNDNGQIESMYTGGLLEKLRFIQSRLFQYGPYFHGKVWMKQVRCAKIRYGR